jgi:fucose 4-O-acetylase-like acetyltransferase
MHYEELNRLRGFAIALVLLGHSILVFPIDISQVPWCAALHNYIYSFHMQLFFLLSGLFYGFGRERTTGELVRNKFNRLMVPFFLWNVFTVSSKVFFSNFVNHTMNMPFTEYVFFFMNGGTLWFLYVLFFIFLVNRLLERIEVLLDQKLILFLLCILSLFNISFPHFPLSSITYHLIYFYLGRMIAPRYPILKVYLQNRYFLLYSAAFFALLGGIDIKIVSRIVRIILPLAGIAFSCSLIFLIRQTTLDRVLSICGIYSLQLYLLDGYLLTLSRHVLVSVLDLTNPAVLVFTIFAVKITAGILLVHWILARFALTRWLIGLTARAPLRSATRNT